MFIKRRCSENKSETGEYSGKAIIGFDPLFDIMVSCLWIASRLEHGIHKQGRWFDSVPTIAY